MIMRRSGIFFSLIMAVAVNISPSNAITETFFAVKKPAEPVTWQVASQACDDGSTHPFLTSKTLDEPATGTLRSADFEAPNSLSFWIAGHSHENKSSIRLIDADTLEVLREARAPGQDLAQPVMWKTGELLGRRIQFVLKDDDSGEASSWLSFGRLKPAVVTMPVTPDANLPSGWNEDKEPAKALSSHGIPFLGSNLWPLGENTLHFETGDLTADRLYLLGGLNSLDRANPPWGGGDSYRNTFIGDEAGSIALVYKSGITDIIPLVFGYTIFWSAPYQLAPEPFVSDAGAARLLDQALYVAGASVPGNRDLFLAISLRDETLRSVTINDNPAKEGHPQVRGLTLGGVKSHDTPPDDSFAKLKGEPEEALRHWLADHVVRSDDPYPQVRRDAVSALARILYTYPEDITTATVAATAPEATSATFSGPSISFHGPVEAQILTNVYFENAQEMVDRIDVNGMVHESAQKADNYRGFGSWDPDLGAFWADSYTRGRTLMVMSDNGFTDAVEKSLHFFDHWLMYFPYSWPGLQLGGKPVPGHWTVVANKPHLYFDLLTEHGWPTRFETRDFGNPETDGHGLLMLAHWRQWLKLGQPIEWVRHHWIPLNEAAEYIPWVLDNPELSFSEHGLMYNESEGGMQEPSLYCDMPCYLGLLAYANMADAIGDSARAERWREQAQRLFTAMNRYYPLQSERWGDVWDPQKSAGWAGDHATLAPALFAMDYHGFEALTALPEEWALRTRRTYQRQLTRNQPEWCSPAGLGYGQCYITQVALLLDEMADADKMIRWLARFCFHPRLPHPYRVPEGVTMATDGSVWRRWGDLGNLYQLSETVYVAKLMAGIDDFDVETLKLMPRIPQSWTGIEVRDHPVRTMSGQESKLVPLHYRLQQNLPQKTLQMQVNFDQTIDRAKVRLGPFPLQAESVTLQVNNAQVTPHLLQQGDSKWTWVELDSSNLSHEISATWRP